MAQRRQSEQDPERVTQAGIWADNTLRGDLLAAGAVFLVVAVLVGYVFDSGDEAQRAQEGGVDIGFGMLGVLLAAIAALVPGRRMPDWAIGLREGAEPLPPLRAPLVMLGWALAGVAALAALVLGGLGPAIGAALIASVAPLALARSLGRFLTRANRTREWAASRGLSWRPEGDPPGATPLLRDGTYRYSHNEVSGRIEEELSGELFHLACVTVDDSPDGTSESTNRYTALLASVPDPGKRLPLCVCAPRSRIPATDAYDAWRRKLKRIDLESSEFERRFELAIGRKGDEVWLRRLFEPTFLERMIKLSAARLGWELEGSKLLVYEPGYTAEPAELDRLASLAALVGSRIRGEVGETTARP